MPSLSEAMAMIDGYLNRTHLVGVSVGDESATQLNSTLLPRTVRTAADAALHFLPDSDFQVFPLFHEKTLRTFPNKLWAMFWAKWDEVRLVPMQGRPTLMTIDNHPIRAAGPEEIEHSDRLASLGTGSPYVMQELTLKHRQTFARYEMIFCLAERINSTEIHPKRDSPGGPFHPRVSRILNETYSWPPSLRKGQSGLSLARYWRLICIARSVQILLLIGLYIGNAPLSTGSCDLPCYEIVSLASATCYAIGLHSSCIAEDVDPVTKQERIRAWVSDSTLRIECLQLNVSVQAVCRQLGRISSMGIGRPNPAYDNGANKDKPSTMKDESRFAASSPSCLQLTWFSI